MNGVKVALLALFALVGGSCTGDVEKKQLLELRKIAIETPVYPGFEKTGERVVLKRGLVYLFNDYKSEAQFGDVTKFYDHVLGEKGWRLPQKPGSSFVVGQANFDGYRRGDYVIYVEEDDRKNGMFSIVFIWDPQ